MSDYEKQVVALIKFKTNDHVDRQDYLASLIKAADKWLANNDENGDIFDGWDNELAGWFDEAVHAMNAKKKIPDFPDIELGEEDTVPDENEPDEVDEAEAEAEANEEETVPDAAEEAGGADVTDEVAPIKNKSNARKSGPRAAKTKHSDFNNVTRDAVEHATRDRFGVIIGTKTHDAVVMYERGCTAREIDEQVGGKHYNILASLAKKGHRVEKLPGNVFKLTHADDLDK